MHSRHDLTDGFRALGVAPGDVVMLHASVRAVGDVAGGPDEIHLALKDTLTESGTLFMYAGCPRFADDVGRGNLTATEEAEILHKLPTFDPLTARADRSNGVLVEFLRTWPGSRVNEHVTRFVVWGQQTAFLLSEQPWNYAFGRDSLLDRFVALDGKILLLGSDHDNVTFLHYVEHVANFPNKRVARFKVPIMENGARGWREMEEFDSANGAHASWPAAFFSTLVDGFLAESRNPGGSVGDARAYLFSARELLRYARPIMERLARTAIAADDR